MNVRSVGLQDLSEEATAAFDRIRIFSNATRVLCSKKKKQKIDVETSNNTRKRRYSLQKKEKKQTKAGRREKVCIKDGFRE